MAKLVFRKPQRTPAAPTGHITDIVLTPGTPILAAATANGTVVGTLAAVDTSGAVTFSIAGVVPNTKFSISGNQLLRATAGGALTAATPEIVTIKAVDARGVAGQYSEDFTIDVFDVPGTISIGVAPGASGQTGTIVSNAANGTQVGTFQTVGASGGSLAGPLTYTRVSDTKFNVGVDSNNRPSMVRTSVSTLAAGVNEAPVIRVTDAGQVDMPTHDETFDIAVTDPPVITAPTRFEDLPLPTPIIALVWNLGGNNPTTSPPTNPVCQEGAASTWKCHSTDCPLIDLWVDTTVDNIRKKALALGYREFTFKFGTVANIYDYEGPYCIQLAGFNQDSTGIVEYIGITGTGNINAGVGPTGVTLWKPPYLQIKQTGTGVSSQLFDLSGGTHAQSKYRINNLRYGCTREEDEASVITVFNVPGATTAAECILHTKFRHAQGIVIAESMKQLCLTHVEVTNTTFSALHCTKKNYAMRTSGIIQVSDSRFVGNGSDNGDHNHYLGDSAHVVLHHNFYSNPSGHNLKFDNQQRFEVFECSLSGYRTDNLCYSRTNGANQIKIFKGTTNDYNNGNYEGALRQVPAVAPFTITGHAFYDQSSAPIVTGRIDSGVVGVAGTVFTVTNIRPNSGTVAAGQTITALSGVAANTTILAQLTGTIGGLGTYSVSVSQSMASKVVILTHAAELQATFTDAGGLSNLGNLTINTAGSPSPGVCVRTVSGVKSLNDTLHTQDALYTFDPAGGDASKWVRLPARGYAGLRNSTQGGAISVDNSNQDFAVFNNIYHAFHYSGAQRTFVYPQGRHQGGDLRHHKQPDYSWQDPSYLNEIDLSTVQGVIGSDSTGQQAGVPKTYVGYISVNPAGGTSITIDHVDFIYSDMFGATGDVDSANKGPLNPDGVTVYDIELRCDNGTVDTRTMVLNSRPSKYGGSDAKFTATLSSPASSTVTGNSVDRRNTVVFKLAASSGGSATWDRPKMITASQGRWFNRADPNYYPHAVTTVTGVTLPNGAAERYLDLRKAEPSVSGLIDGIPVGYVYNNGLFPLPDPDQVAQATMVDASIVQSLNACFSTKFYSSGNSYDCRMADPPQNASDHAAWAYNAAYGDFDLRLSTHPVASGDYGGPMLASEVTDGFGPRGTDMIRFNAVVVKENGIFDYHLPPSGQYSGAGNVGDSSVSAVSYYNSPDMYADLRAVPQIATTTDMNGCVRFTTAYKTSFPPYVDPGTPFAVIGPHLATGGSFGAIYVAGAHSTRVDGLRLRTLPFAGGARAPTVNMKIQIECDTQMGVGEGIHNATITTVAAVAGDLTGTMFDVLFTPGVTQVGDTDPILGSVTLGHEKGVSICSDQVNFEELGGRGVFMDAAIISAEVDDFWLDPQDIPD